MHMLHRKDMDMTHGTIWRQLIAFALPTMIGMLFQQLYNVVDTMVVGLFVGTEAQAAVGTTGPIINTLVGLSMGLSTGATVLVSQRYGAHDDEGLAHAVHTAAAAVLLLGAGATAMGILSVRPMLRLNGTPEDVLPFSSLYLTIYFLGMIPLLFYNLGSAILRAVGDSTRPLYFLILSAVLNTIGDLVLVIVFDMGIAGVAIATVGAEAISALMVFVVLSREKASYGLRVRQLHLHRDSLQSILAVGLPSGVQQALTAFSNVFVQSYINAFGTAVMAAWGIYNKLDAFVLIPAQCVAMASTTFVGQNWGADQPRRARDGVSTALKLSLLCTLVLAVILFAAAPLLVQSFTRDAETARYAVFFCRLIDVFYLLICFNQTYAGALRGIGNATAPTIIMLSSFVLFRQVYLFVSSRLTDSIIPVALAYPVGWLLCSVLLAIFYHRSALFRCDRKSPAPQGE